MVKTHVKVYVRTRPCTASYDGLKIQAEAGSISIRVPKDAGQGIVNNQQENFSFKFDGVLENESQERVYTSTTHEVVDSLLAGYNGTVFCYGQVRGWLHACAEDSMEGTPSRGLFKHIWPSYVTMRRWRNP